MSRPSPVHSSESFFLIHFPIEYRIHPSIRPSTWYLFLLLLFLFNLSVHKIKSGTIIWTQQIFRSRIKIQSRTAESFPKIQDDGSAFSSSWEPFLLLSFFHLHFFVIIHLFSLFHFFLFVKFAREEGRAALLLRNKAAESASAAAAVAAAAINFWGTIIPHRLAQKGPTDQCARGAFTDVTHERKYTPPPPLFESYTH